MLNTKNTIDLRSDTLTLPTDEMKEAMICAKIGDDGREDSSGRGSDPTVNKLEDCAAQLMNKEAALFCTSTTMANIISLITQCSRGSRVAVEPYLHVVRDEKGPFMSQLFGLKKVQYKCTRIGIPDLNSFETICASEIHQACIENTHNFGGGICIPLKHSQQIYQIAKKYNVLVHLDGARIFNTAVALNTEPKEFAACCDTVSLSLTKGLGAPFGSLLCGKKNVIKEARKIRKLIGGGLRQAGIMAAAGIIALQHAIPTLEADHANASFLGEQLACFKSCKLIPVETNIVMLDISKTEKTTDWFVNLLKKDGLLVKGMGDNYIRMTTYRGITKNDVCRAAKIFTQLMKDSKIE